MLMKAFEPFLPTKNKSSDGQKNQSSNGQTNQISNGHANQSSDGQTTNSIFIAQAAYSLCRFAQEAYQTPEDKNLDGFWDHTTNDGRVLYISQ